MKKDDEVGSLIEQSYWASQGVRTTDPYNNLLVTQKENRERAAQGARTNSPIEPLSNLQLIGVTSVILAGYLDFAIRPSWPWWAHITLVVASYLITVSIFRPFRLLTKIFGALLRVFWILVILAGMAYFFEWSGVIDLGLL